MNRLNDGIANFIPGFSGVFKGEGSKNDRQWGSREKGTRRKGEARTLKIKSWNPEKIEGELVGAAMEKLREAAELVADRARALCPVGSISRPMYKTGPYAGQPWTARDAGQLKRSIRVRELNDKYGTAFVKHRNIRIYAGNERAYYASIVEYSGKPFMRRAFNGARMQIREILGAK